MKGKGKWEVKELFPNVSYALEYSKLYVSRNSSSYTSAVAEIQSFSIQI